MPSVYVGIFEVLQRDEKYTHHESLRYAKNLSTEIKVLALISKALNRRRKVARARRKNISCLNLPAKCAREYFFIIVAVVVVGFIIL